MWTAIKAAFLSFLVDFLGGLVKSVAQDLYKKYKYREAKEKAKKKNKKNRKKLEDADSLEDQKDATQDIIDDY